MKNTQTFTGAAGTLMALGVAAGIGLAAFDPVVDNGPRGLPADANARRAPGFGFQAPAPVTAPSGRRELDPALGRIEANDHHG